MKSGAKKGVKTGPWSPERKERWMRSRYPKEVPEMTQSEPIPAIPDIPIVDSVKEMLG